MKCVALQAGIPCFLVEQHLDDLLLVGSNKEEDSAVQFHEVFLAKANRVGFRADCSNNRERNHPSDLKV